MKKIFDIVAGFLGCPEIIEFIFTWLKKASRKTETNFDDKAVEIAEYVITDRNAHRVIDKLLAIIREEQAK